MKYLTFLLYLPIVFWVGIYTFFFGRWCLKQKNIAGAVFVFMLASASVVVPIFILFFGV